VVDRLQCAAEFGVAGHGIRKGKPVNEDVHGLSRTAEYRRADLRA
jgi:hypothetical protein